MMKWAAYLAIAVAVVSLIIGIISRLTWTPVSQFKLEAHAFLDFSIACLLFAINLILLKMLKESQ